MTRRQLLRWLALAPLPVGAAAAGGMSGCAVRPSSPPLTLSIATGGERGVYWAFGQALAHSGAAREDGLRLDVESSAGSLDNLSRLRSGRARLAFTAADAAADVAGGPGSLRALARVYDDYLHLLVRPGSGITSLADLAGRRVSLGGTGSGTELIALRVLEPSALVSQLQRHPLGLAESLDALARGDLDAAFWSGGLPTGGVADAARAGAVDLVPLPESGQTLRQAYGDAYRPALIPASTYGLAADTPTLAVANLIVSLPTLPDEAAHRVVTAMFAARSDISRTVTPALGLDADTAIFTDPVPLHRGALRYYRETKP